MKKINREQKLEKALKEIQTFGYKNAGCGYSCAKIAEEALKEKDKTGVNELF